MTSGPRNTLGSRSTIICGRHRFLHDETWETKVVGHWRGHTEQDSVHSSYGGNDRTILASREMVAEQDRRHVMTWMKTWGVELEEATVCRVILIHCVVA